MSYIDHLVPINNVCNQKCNFCSAEYRMKWNKPIPMKFILQDIMSKWDYIQISWWEPLLHPKLYDILYFVKKYKPGCFIEFQSNGTHLLKNNNLNKLLKFNINLFNINYPCHIESINDEVAWIPGTLEPRENAMRSIIDKGWKLRINIIVNKVNLPFIGESVDYIQENFSWLERIQFSFTKAMWAANKNDEVVPKYEDAEPYFIEALSKCKKYNIRADVDHIPMCFLGEYYENHVDYHKMKVWETGVFLTEKNYVEKCETCDKKHLCPWYRKDYLEIYQP